MRSVLVVYGTGDGQTEKIARFIAHRLGVLKYTQYNPLKRWVMRRIVRKTGSPDLDT
jgi:menaquinone-dependent protoporphyrinogen IX oxidase